MRPIVSVKELMQYLIDPLSDRIFEAVSSDSGTNGPIEHRPTTEVEWEDVRSGAIGLAEAIYLLKVPRPFAPPGDLNNSTGPNATELAPSEIKAMVEKDPVTWNAKIEALRNVGLEVMQIVDRVGSKPILISNPFRPDPGRTLGTPKDAEDLFAAGRDLDNACESCHVMYWYPKDPIAAAAQRALSQGAQR
jgi:hypothetical protein